jgi:flagellar motor switch protein FliG
MTMTADFDYRKLSRPQKLAVFLIVVGPESAAEMLRQFDDASIEVLCREMATFPIVPANVQKQAMEEFSGLIAQSAGSALGGKNFAQKTLELAKGQHASAILGRVNPGEASGEAIKQISEMEGRQIFNLLKHEQPQTISFLLAHLDSAKSAEVVALLNPSVREEVMERMGTIETTSLELVGKITRRLGQRFSGANRPSFHRTGGATVVADLLNELDKDLSKSLLAGIEERNATLGAEIRKKLFSFDDLLQLQASDFQRVLREVDSANLAVSIKGASEAMRKKIYGAISKRAAESLREEVELLGPTRIKDVEIAQEAIVNVVRRLEEEGQITLDAATGEGVIA